MRREIFECLSIAKSRFFDVPVWVFDKPVDFFLKKDQNRDLEVAAEDLRQATRHLGSLVGKVDVEEILGSIFKDFCIGK